MKYYAIYNTETQQLSKAQCRCLNKEVQNIEITKYVFDNFDKYTYLDGRIVLDVEYELKQKSKEQERIAMLSLTAADVERGIYKAKGLDFDDIIEMVKSLNATTPEEGTEGYPKIDVKALKIELKANNFYRGNPYVDAVGSLLGFTKEQLDLFFETGDFIYLMEKEELISEDEIPF